MALFGITPLLFVLAVALNPSTSADEVVSTIIVTAPPAYPTNPPSYTSNSIFESAILAASNFYRVEHHAVPLQWNDSLADYAQNWAKGCQFEHSQGPYGENLAAGYPNATSSISAWGDERKDYDYSDPDFSEKTGHFSQLVWKASRTVGCGKTFCNGADDTPGWYIVCEYYPRGNVMGDFADNVESQTGSSPSEPSGAGSTQEGAATSHGVIRDVLWVLVSSVVAIVSW